MINVLEQRDPREIGTELQSARRRAGLTQEEAAQFIDVARTTLVAIEKGERRIKASELMKLAKAYKCQVNELVRLRSKTPAFEVQFRGPAQMSEAEQELIAPTIEQFQELCRGYLELEQKLHTILPKRYPEQYAVGQMSVEQAAEWIASEERRRLGLGDNPIPNLRSILEQEVGLRIFCVPMHGKFSAIYIFTDELGGCICLNSNHPEERRRFSLSHDYLHFLAHRYQADVYAQDNFLRVPRSEQVADAFAINFLMPKHGLTRTFNETQRSMGKVTASDICVMANHYGVSVQAMTLRLEDLRLLPVGVWDKIKRSQLNLGDIQQSLGLSPLFSTGQMLPIRYQVLSISAYERGEISEEQLAQFLYVDVLQARGIAESVGELTTDLTSDSKVKAA